MSNAGVAQPAQLLCDIMIVLLGNDYGKDHINTRIVFPCKGFGTAVLKFKMLSQVFVVKDSTYHQNAE